MTRGKICLRRLYLRHLLKSYDFANGKLKAFRRNDSNYHPWSIPCQSNYPYRAAFFAEMGKFSYSFRRIYFHAITSYRNVWRLSFRYEYFPPYHRNTFTRRQAIQGFHEVDERPNIANNIELDFSQTPEIEPKIFNGRPKIPKLTVRVPTPTRK